MTHHGNDSPEDFEDNTFGFDPEHWGQAYKSWLESLHTEGRVQRMIVGQTTLLASRPDLPTGTERYFTNLGVEIIGFTVDPEGIILLSYDGVQIDETSELPTREEMGHDLLQWWTTLGKVTGGFSDSTRTGQMRLFAHPTRNQNIEIAGYAIVNRGATDIAPEGVWEPILVTKAFEDELGVIGKEIIFEGEEPSPFVPRPVGRLNHAWWAESDGGFYPLTYMLLLRCSEGPVAVPIPIQDGDGNIVEPVVPRSHLEQEGIIASRRPATHHRPLQAYVGVLPNPDDDKRDTTRAMMLALGMVEGTDGSWDISQEVRNFLQAERLLLKAGFIEVEDSKWRHPDGREVVGFNIEVDGGRFIPLDAHGNEVLGDN